MTVGSHVEMATPAELVAILGEVHDARPTTGRSSAVMAGLRPCPATWLELCGMRGIDRTQSAR